MTYRWVLLFVGLTAAMTQSVRAEEGTQCPGFLDHDFKRLHSSETLNLCSLYKGKPMLMVNTASHCGYTKQFKPLEALHQKYKDQGFQIVGFASDDFNQEARTEEEAAEICYENFGVTFTMLAPTGVKGEGANPVFAWLADKSGKQPEWNFNKYLVSGDGRSVTHFNQKAPPMGGELEQGVVQSLQGE